MITNSYNASCYIDNEDGQYHIECEVNSNGKNIYSYYDGSSFVDGLNQIMNDVSTQMLKEPDTEPEPETLEEKVVRLEELVKQLQNEKVELNNTINNLKNNKTINYNYKEKIKTSNDTLENILNDLLNLNINYK